MKVERGFHSLRSFGALALVSLSTTGCGAKALFLKHHAEKLGVPIVLTRREFTPALESIQIFVNGLDFIICGVGSSRPIRFVAYIPQLGDKTLLNKRILIRHVGCSTICGLTIQCCSCNGPFD